MELFQQGEQASRSKLMAGLEEIRTAGTSMLDQLEENRLVTLVDFERGLSALNGRRVRGARAATPGVPVRFVTSDFHDIDQLATTATVRADSESVTLRERSTPVDAVVRRMSFSTSVGEVEQLDNQQVLYRVTTTGGVIPTGVFVIELQEAVGMTLLVLDMSAMLSEPAINVEVSADNVSYSPALAISRSGYRLNAWVRPQPARFARVTVTPSHPDAGNGSSFTFGLTDFFATSLEFNLASDWLSRPLSFAPRTQTLLFAASGDLGLSYALRFNGPSNPWQEVTAGSQVAVPGVIGMAGSAIAMDGEGCLAWTLEEDAYLSTLRVTEEGTERELTVVPGLSHQDSYLPRLINKYIAVEPPYLYLVRDDVALDIGNTYQLSYLHGPEELTVELRVHLLSPDKALSPIFRGATLEEM